MISNFIAHLQGSAYRGEKFARPRRLEEQAGGQRQAAPRAAQLANMSRRGNPPPET
jgi:hypothetical protein